MCKYKGIYCTYVYLKFSKKTEVLPYRMVLCLCIHILTFIAQYLPEMLGWVEWMLTAPANLYCLLNCRGLKLFSAGIHAVISSCNANFPEVWGCWYLDDGSLVGPLGFGDLPALPTGGNRSKDKLQ